MTLRLHQIDLCITEHYINTAGGTDHGLLAIRVLNERKLYTIEEPGSYPLPEPLIGEAIEAGVLLPSVIARSGGPTRALLRALRALGHIDAGCSPLEWPWDAALRQRSHTSLNKTHARHARACRH